MVEKKVKDELDPRKEMIDALKSYFGSKINMHRINIEVLLTKNVGVAEHPDVMTTVEEELSKMAEYHDKLEMLREYFRSV